MPSIELQPGGEGDAARRSLKPDPNAEDEVKIAAEGEVGNEDEGKDNPEHKEEEQIEFFKPEEDHADEGQKEEEAQTGSESTASVPSDETIAQSPFTYQVSEEELQESDLQARKKRRYLIGKHSFLELNDPHLEDALDPADANKEQGETIEKQKKHAGVAAERKKYKELCEEKGIKPNPTFLNSIGGTVVDLTNQGLSDKEIETICLALCDDKNVEICRLSGNRCGKLGGLAIAEMIKENKTIEELRIANTEILEALEEICEAASESTNLVLLDLSKNELIDGDMGPVSAMIAENHSLKVLLLSMNDIKDPGLLEIGNGLKENKALVHLDLSGNKIRGESASPFFQAAAKHRGLRNLIFPNNLIKNPAGFAQILSKNPKIEWLDLSFNIMDGTAGSVLGAAIGNGKSRDLHTLELAHARWNQQSAAELLAPLANPKNSAPLKIVDFGWTLDIHKNFIDARDKVLTIHPDLKIIHGVPYGLWKPKNPEEKPLVIRRANVVCENFETPLVMLMEELAKEPKTMNIKDFRKFIKQCNLYKDQSLTEAFENVFATPEGDVDGAAILEAFDKEYPGLRKIPEPQEESKKDETKSVKSTKSKKSKKKKKGGTIRTRSKTKSAKSGKSGAKVKKTKSKAKSAKAKK